MTIEQPYMKIIENLASAVGLQPSKIVLDQPEGSLDRLLYMGQEIAWLIDINHQIRSVTLFLPYVRSEQSWVTFSQNVVEGFRLKEVGLIYHVNNVHPEFNELLEGLRQTKRIPREKLSYVSELAIRTTENGLLYGSVSYELGTPQIDRLCMKVDKEFKDSVPEAEEQQDQSHYCIHDRDPSFIPFKPFKFSTIGIRLHGKGNEGGNYLKEILEGTLVPQDGLQLRVDDYGEIGMYREPYRSPCFQISINNPENKENWEKQLTLVRRLEYMFKTKQ